MILALLGLAHAQQPLELVSDETELQPCLDSAGCGGILVRLASESLLELAYFMSSDPLMGTALNGRGTGFVFEIHADTYPLGEPNLVTEQVTLPPLLPKLDIAYQLGSFTYDDPYPQLALGLSVLPPLKVNGYEAAGITLTGSAALPLYEHYVWGGVELAGSYGRVAGEMLGDGSVLEDVASIAPFVDLGTPACADTEPGCRDRIHQSSFTGRVGLNAEPHPAVFFFLKGGLSRVGSRLEVAYDTSSWRLKGVRPELGYGGGVRIADRAAIALGGITTARPEAVSSDDSRTMTRFHVSLSVRTGDRRYWYDEETDTEPVDDEPTEGRSPE